MTEPRLKQRRTLVFLGAGLAATAAGAWLALRHGSEQAPAAQPTSSGAAEAAEPALWGLRFDTLSGEPLVMASLRGKPLLINFWATWCAPCVREMPQIDRFYREHSVKGWQVLGLAIDGPTPVREFLGKQPVSFTIGLAGLEGTELARALGNDRGGLPFSVAFDASGAVVQRKLGETSYEELASWAAQLR